MTINTTPEQALDGVELIKPGPAVSMSGQAVDFTAEIVADIVASYDPAVHEAPHVKGHPTTDGPAVGWVKSLALTEDGRALLQQSRQVDPAFADDVLAGRWKKRSLALYTPSAPNNPKPGHWYPKHVGWLGAVPPAIKGLRDAHLAFAEPEPGVLTFAGWDDEVNAGMWRRMREWFIAQFGTETADRVVPAWEVDALQREAMRPEPEPQVSNPPGLMAYTEGAPAVTTADPNSPAALAARAAELDARAARITEQEAAQAALIKSARSAGLASFADAMVAEGRLLPAERPAVLAAMQAVPDTCTVVQFADGDPTKPEAHPAVEAFKAFIKALPPRVEFGERAKPDGAVQLDTEDPQAIAKAAAAYQFAERQAGREVGMDVAVEHVVRQAAG